MMVPPVYAIRLEPNQIRAGDKIRIKGILQDQANQFSINFANEICNNPSNITYHFKWILEENILVQAYKENNEWCQHTESSYDGGEGAIFELEFAFQDDEIIVYRIFKDTPNQIASFSPQFELSEIRAIQVRDDVMSIKEVTFKYA